MQEYQKSGYLYEDFRMFHNTDAPKKEIPFHYHDFHKILLLLSGNISYIIEGRQYQLQSGDIVIVHAGQIHRPVMEKTSVYDRIIFYISPEFFRKAENGIPALPSVSGLLRLSGEAAAYYARLTAQLKSAAHDEGYGADLLRRIRLLELLILIDRTLIDGEVSGDANITANPLVLSAMDYIRSHLTDETLDIDSVAAAVSLNRSYLMHLFKSQVGLTIGQYIKEKRLYMAQNLIGGGMSVTQACFQSGFKNYAAFYYAYRQKHSSGADKKRPDEDQE